MRCPGGREDARGAVCCTSHLRIGAWNFGGLSNVTMKTCKDLWSHASSGWRPFGPRFTPRGNRVVSFQKSEVHLDSIQDIIKSQTTFFEFPWPKGDSRIWDNDYLCVNALIESKCVAGKPKRKWTMEHYRIPKPCLADHATQDACVSSKRVKKATQKTKNKQYCLSFNVYIFSCISACAFISTTKLILAERQFKGLNSSPLSSGIGDSKVRREGVQEMCLIIPPSERVCPDLRSERSTMTLLTCICNASALTMPTFLFLSFTKKIQISAKHSASKFYMQ